MNDITLSALLNLFALFGSDNKLDKKQALELISNYLKRHYGVRNPQSYLNLYGELRDFYDEFPDMDRGNIIGGICSKLQGKISAEDQAGLLLRLLEFCSLNNDGFDPDAEIFRKVVAEFRISEEMYGEFLDFVTGKPGKNVLVIRPGDGKDTVKTLYIRDLNILAFTYIGDREVKMNDIPVTSGMFQIWQQSAVLKSPHFKPMYYSTIMSMYSNNERQGKIEMCGRNIEFRFRKGGNNGMHNFSFDLHSGELVAIMGGSGVGKSTLLSLLNGTLSPQSGRITVNGHDISEPGVKALIGYVPQDDLLIEDLTVYENLKYTAKLCFSGISDEELDRKVRSVLVQLGLDKAAGLKVGSPINKFISGGQRKRLNIALELIREPAILFLDEPTSGLSSADTEKVVNLLKEQTYKGRLIVTNIHQPSSDVYKLFDRLWVLDTGGYPIYDGNPIEAVSYFKTAANYIDAQASACPVCGNVNPEVVLNIVDEKALDNNGHLTEIRKVTPEDWHELYLHEMSDKEAPAITSVPETEQKRPSRLRQTLIFLQRNLKAKLADLQYVLVTLLEAPVLAVICALLTRYTPDNGIYTVLDNKNMVSYYFMAIIVSIFLGMAGSAEAIIKDRSLLKREKFLNLSYGSYIWSKIIYMAGVCLVQTILFILVGNAIMGIGGPLWLWWIILFAAAFLSGLIGLLLSQFMGSVVAIYITIPLLLIPQILLCGLVVKFEDLNSQSPTGNVPLIGDVIPSRWAYEALAVGNFSKNAFEKNFFEQDRDKFTAQYYERAFLYELESQLETREDDEREDRAHDPSHTEIIRTGLPQLAQVCDMEPYEGDYSYESLDEYFSKAHEILSKRGNRTTLAMDKQVRAFIKEHSLDEMLALKRDNYNMQLENLVLNRDTDRVYAVIGNNIVPRSGYIFLTPQSRCGRAPFYSGVKVVGHYEIDTVWYNLGVLLLMCIMVAVCLFADFPGRYIRK